MYTENRNTTDSEFHRSEILQKIEKKESEQYEYKNILKKIEVWEEESFIQMNRSKALNNQLLENATGDSRLFDLLLKREDILQRRNVLETKLFSGIRENLNKALNEAERTKEDYLTDLKSLD